MTTIRQLRLNKGWSQQVLAHKARLSMGTVAKADKGEPISRNNLAHLCDALGINVEDVTEVQYKDELAAGE